MAEIKSISIKGKLLTNLPLYYKKIYYNDLATLLDEEKLYFSSSANQSIIVKRKDPKRNISKLIDYDQFKIK